MATKFASVYKQELKSKGILSSMGSAVLKSARERMDVRNMLFGGKGMLSATGQKIFGRGYSALSSGATGAPSSAQAAAQSSATSDLISSSERQEALLRVISKNTFNMNMMARDMNITRQNISTLTRLAAGKSAKSQDAMWYDVKTRNQSIDSLGKKTPTKASGNTQSSGSGIFGLLGGLFSGGANLLGAVVSGLLGTVGAIGGGILSTIGSVLKFIPGGFLIGTIALAGVAYLIKKVSENINFSGLTDKILRGLGLDPDDKENSLTKQILKKLGFSDSTAGKIENTFTDIGKTFTNIFDPVVRTMLIHSKAAFNTLAYSFSILGEEFRYQADKLFNENRGKIFAAIALGYMGPAVLLSPLKAGAVAGLALAFGAATSEKSVPELEKDLANLDEQINKRMKENAVNRNPKDVRPLYKDPTRPGLQSIMELYEIPGLFGIGALSAREQEMAKLEKEKIETKAALEVKRLAEEASRRRQEELKNLPKTLQERYLEDVERQTRIQAADDALADRQPSNPPPPPSQSAAQPPGTAPTRIPKMDDLIHGRYRVSSEYGDRVSPTDRTKREFHKGVDIALRPNHPLTAAVDGEVISVGNNLPSGNFVSIKDADGNVYSYSHLNSSKVIKGQKVKRGDLIGLSGSTGRSTGPHLHFGVKDKQGNYRSPTEEEVKNAISVSEKISALSIENMDQRRALMSPDAGGGTTVNTTNNNYSGGRGDSQAFAGVIDAEAMYLFAG
jgi:murein DD-endopeptidase MepM/ murein hydrolase activator NlpD